MENFIVKATFTKTYEVEVEASSADEAIDKLDDWVARDFENYQVGAHWDFEA